jgi:hypothetical protein
MKARHFLTAATVSLITGALPLLANEASALFRSSEILPPDLIVGPHHRVRELAEADGFLIHFTVDSDFGVYECSGLGELRRRVAEIGAIAQLVEVSKGDLFAEGLRKSIESPIGAVRNIAEDPGATLKQVPKSVGHFFGKVGSGIGNAVRKAGEERPDSDRPDGEAVARGVGRVLRSAAGFDKAKLECARQLGADPYSDNVRLQEEMEKVAWAFFAGGLPLKVGVSLASGGASRAIGAVEFVGLPDELYELTPSELDFQDRNALKGMGVPPERIDALFANPHLIRSVRHAMVGALAELGVAGRLEIVEQLATVDTVWRAHFLNEALQLLRWRHRGVGYQGCSVHGRLPAGMAPDGTLEIPAPIDYVIWTPEVEAFATREDIARFPRRLVHQGTLSAETLANLGALGWEIVKVPR